MAILGVLKLKTPMFVRKKKNLSGSTSIQIIHKTDGKYKVVETIGSTKDKNHLEYLIKKVHYRISEILGQEELKLFAKNRRKSRGIEQT